MSQVKRFVILMLGLGFWAGQTVVDLLRRVLGGQRSSRCVALYYHGVSAAQRGRFRRQMELLRSRMRVVSLDEATSSPDGGLQVCITFDDGFESVWRNAVPVLVELGLAASVFVVSGNLGRRPEWQMAPDDPDAGQPLMSAAQLVLLRRAGITVGSHTVRHRNLARLSSTEAYRELAESKRALEVLLGGPVDVLSLPFGDYNDQTFRIARDVGYQTVLTCEPQLITRRGDRFVVGRFKVSPDDWLVEFRLKAAGAYAWLWYVRWFKRACVGIADLLLGGRLRSGDGPVGQAVLARGSKAVDQATGSASR